MTGGDDGTIDVDLEELRQLACLVAGQPDLSVEEGPPGSGWSFSPSLRRISMDRQRLRTESWNFTRGLLLHETGHAAITRLHDLLKEDYLRRPDVFGLLNAVEDCRLETFLAERFPGSRPWIREYNDLLLKARIPDPGPLGPGEAPPLSHFVAALLCGWWHGREKVPIPDVLRPWVDEAWPHLEAICRCLPVAATTHGFSAPRYHADEVCVVYSGPDLLDPPCPWEMEVRIAQAAMWRIFTQGLLPIARKLAPPSRPIRMPNQLERLFERWLQEHHLGPGVIGTAGLQSPLGASLGGLDQVGGTHRCSRRPSRTPGTSTFGMPHWTPDAQAYASAVDAQQQAIERLGAVVLRILQPRTQRRWTGPHRSGVRLNLDSARRAESDSRLQDLVWDRPGEPRRPDPLIVLLLDRSGSMEGEKIEATLKGAVLLGEVCHRLGISLGIYTFANRCDCLLNWRDDFDPGKQALLGGLPRAAEGGTRLEAALWRIHADLTDHGYGERFVVVLSDGEPGDGERPGLPVDALERDGTRVMGLGVGPGTANLSQHLPHCRAALDPARVPEAFASMLMRAVMSR